MAGFSVDTDVLKNLSREISRVGADFGEAGQPSPLDAGEAGSGDVARALEKFHDHWNRERDKLWDNLTKLADAVTMGADGYEQADVTVSTAASGGSVTVADGGSSGSVSTQ